MTTNDRSRSLAGRGLLLVAGSGVLVLGLQTVQGSPGAGPNGVPFAQLDALMTSLNASIDALGDAVDSGTAATRPNVGPRTAGHLVTLRGRGTPCATAGASGQLLDARVMTDGSEADFAVPPGQVVVITGLAWRTAGNTAHAGATLRLEPPGSLTTAFVDTQPALASGIGGAVASIPGIAVGPGVGICLVNSGDSAGAPSGVLYGYLAAVEP